MRNAPDKNPFSSVNDLLARAAPAKRNVHFLSYLVDTLLVVVVSYLLFLGGLSIVKNTDSYKQNNQNYEAEITYYQDMVVEAHLAEYLDRDTHLLADDEDLAIKMAISQVLQSYSHDDPSSPDFIEDPANKLKETYVGTFYSDCFVPISFNNDYISQFVIDYVPSHNENEELIHFNGITPEKYIINIYKGHSTSREKIKFVYSADDSAIPYLRPDVANDIYEYLVRAEGFSRDAYDSFVEFYSSMLTDCEDLVVMADSYQKGHYQDYLRYRRSITVATDTTILISIVLGYYLAVFLPQIIFKDGRTFGKIFLRLGVVNTDKSEVEIWKVILRSILGALSFVYLSFFIMLLPPFNGASFLMYLPYITIGSLDITLLIIVIVVFVMVSINGIVMLLTHEKRNIVDLVFKTVTVDVTMLDEPDYDEKNETHL